MASTLVDKILNHLASGKTASTLDLANVFKEDHQKIIGALKSIQAAGDLVKVDAVCNKSWELTEEGRTVCEKGSHEALVFSAVPADGIDHTALMKTSPNAKVGFSKAMSSGWIVMDKSSGAAIVKRKVESITDVVQQHLKELSAGKSDGIPENLKQDYKKRKLIQEIVIKSYALSKGPEFSTTLTKMETDLTADMLASGSWKNLTFKEYNLKAMGAPLEFGSLHPLMEVRAEFRNIFVEMGFQEMPTNNYVESSFWNFDALFVPQQHPARDAQDTFFVSDPSASKTFPKDYLSKVRRVHSSGGYGSQGYRYNWKIGEAEKNVLRTHTTGTSARMLHKLMQDGPFKPVKYFSIDKVFRNETLDATHLAEFHQVEGVVADYNLSLGNLIGLFNEFFGKLGITELEYKPTYNPYTEPSMEIFCYHKGLKKWIEVGNSGVFRPEMLIPLGLPETVNVIAWGLSLERPTMIKYGYTNIRDLVGPKVNLQMIHNSPLCRMDK